MALRPHFDQGAKQLAGGRRALGQMVEHREIGDRLFVAAGAEDELLQPVHRGVGLARLEMPRDLAARSVVIFLDWT